jgi:hypothetical protein
VKSYSIEQLNTTPNKDLKNMFQEVSGVLNNEDVASSEAKGHLGNIFG